MVRATELFGGVHVAESGGPADQVVGEHRAGQPGGVGEESTGRAVLEPSAFFQVADGELDRGVGAVELVDGDGGQFEVRDERVVAPVGPQSALGGLGEAGAAHDEPQLASVPALRRSRRRDSATWAWPPSG